MRRPANDSFTLRGLIALTEVGNAPSRRTLERAMFVHGEDSVMRFQGAEQMVSRYFWRPGAGK